MVCRTTLDSFVGLKVLIFVRKLIISVQLSGKENPHTHTVRPTTAKIQFFEGEAFGDTVTTRLRSPVSQIIPVTPRIITQWLCPEKEEEPPKYM